MSNGRLPTVLVSAGHATVDLYQGLIPVLLPFLVLERNYDYSAVSGFVLAATALSALTQPLFGLASDRLRVPWLIPAGMAMAGLGACLVGLVDSYFATLLVIAVSGIGVAAYHPEAARLARATGDVSWFSLGGNLGFAAAPLLAAPVLAWGGLAATPVLVLPALLGIAVTVPLLRQGKRAPVSAETRAANDWPSFLRLTAVTVFRSIVYIGLSTFVGLFVAQRPGGSAAVTIGALFAGGAVGTVLGGRLARRWGRVRTLRIAYAAATFLVPGVALVPGLAVYVLVFLAGLALYVPFSLHITLGQDYLPSRAATASGVTLGLAVSAGGVFAMAVAALAEATSLRVALACLTVLPAAAWLLSRTLPERVHRKELQHHG
ncbi:MFS transporter, FSR family, fosmidomycin resistance protein [Amycolatopsis xylanica]|uniref:MFS transporter, FSR family, fosmidomycin resistance protein n=1 Tax=Amycolatopsis xylanica TaxID=589385 RepID=A0A1H3H0J7_9PSEU|nr:MFS transporter [Amycolatopsis xylanica]SDY08438.1 MFS transporter, FSR family, fosmidomycin resistance protein [Amycolatopsis xylanica]